MVLQKQINADRAWPRLCGVLLCGLVAFNSIARADDSTPDNEATSESPLSKVKWIIGPAKAALGSIATINVPAGYKFAGPDGVRLVDEATHNVYNPQELGVILPRDASWFLLFSYEDSGHVDDNEKNALDTEAAEKILASIKSATESGNSERSSHGWDPLTITGWQQSPFYDNQTQHLTWAIRVSSTKSGVSSESINYNSRILGRTGVISANMVIDPSSLAATVPTYRSVIGGITYSSGNRYEEFRQGDKIAKYGLIGLMTGGAAVAAVKFWPAIAKFGIFIVAGIGGAFKWLMSKFTGKSKGPAA